jgi:hypothetical protein
VHIDTNSGGRGSDSRYRMQQIQLTLSALSAHKSIIIHFQIRGTAGKSVIKTGGGAHMIQEHTDISVFLYHLYQLTLSTPLYLEETKSSILSSSKNILLYVKRILSFLQ